MLLAACDRQVDADYPGESLLRIEGSVSIPAGLEADQLVPAILWEAFDPNAPRYTYVHTSLRPQPVEVQGDFPSGFTLDVYDPPPASVVRELAPGEVAVAYGWLAAVAPDYPEAVTVALRQSTCGDRCDWMVVCEGLNVDVNLDLDPSEDCYRQDIQVGDPPAFETAVLGSGGNQALAFGGFAKGFHVVYFAADVERDTLIAEAFNGAEPISAGYHVYYRAPSEITTAGTDLGESEQCTQDAFAMALQRYNEEHGTQYDFVDHIPDTVVNDNIIRAGLRLRRELDCPPLESSYEDADESVGLIEIELGINSLLNPF